LENPTTLLPSVDG